MDPWCSHSLGPWVTPQPRPSHLILELKFDTLKPELVPWATSKPGRAQGSETGERSMLISLSSPALTQWMGNGDLDGSRSHFRCVSVIRPKLPRPHALHAHWMFITCYSSFESHGSCRKFQMFSQLSTHSTLCLSLFPPYALKFHVVWQNVMINPSVVFLQHEELRLFA